MNLLMEKSSKSQEIQQFMGSRWCKTYATNRCLEIVVFAVDATKFQFGAPDISEVFPNVLMLRRVVCGWIFQVGRSV